MTTEKLITCKTMNSFDCISQLLISLLGEPSFFLKISADGTKFVVIPEGLLSLPSYIALKIDKIAQMATNVKNIESWRKELIGVDTIKRAFIESICDSFNVFLNLVDTMRMNQISGTAISNFESIIAFVMQWFERIIYVHRLTIASHNKCGMELMNMVFMEWSMQCIVDWSYNLLEMALNRMSLAFHKLACAWLLDGKLTPKINWMIREEEISQQSKTNKIETTNILARQHSNSEKNLTLITSKSNTLIAIASVYDKVKFDSTYSPLFLSGCHGLVRKIYDIGRNVFFLRELRCQKNYEYRLIERTKLIEDEQLNKSKLWYSIAERGRLYSIIQQYSEIVCEDVMNEIIVKQRLFDHVFFVQTHFLLLYGDFVSGIYDAIRDSPVKSRSVKKMCDAISPFSVKIKSSAKNSSRLDFMAQACVNYALSFTSQLMAFTGLKACLMAEKAQQTSSTALLEDLVRLSYKPPAAVSAVLSDYMIQIYARIFATIAPYRIYFDRLEATAQRFVNIQRRRRHRKRRQFSQLISVVALAIPRDNCAIDKCEKMFRIVQYVIFTLRQFNTVLLNYFFEKVLSTECLKVMKLMHHQTDLPSLILSHNNFLTVITVALFLHKSAKQMHDALRYSLREARRLLKCVDEFVFYLEEMEIDDNKHDSKVKCTLNNVQLNEYKAFLLQCYSEFFNHVKQVKMTFENIGLLHESVRQSIHWQHFDLPNFMAISTEDDTIK